MGKVYDAVVKWNDFFGGCNLCHKCGGAPRDLCLLLRAHLIANLTSTCPPRRRRKNPAARRAPLVLWIGSGRGLALLRAMA